MDISNNDDDILLNNVMDFGQTEKYGRSISISMFKKKATKRQAKEHDHNM